jgi:hypothetical protein
MIPINQAQLDAIRDECYSIVTTRASISAGASALPTPGVDIAADVALLMELIPAINRKFGLSQEDIESYDAITKQMLYQVIKRAGLSLIGTTITKSLIANALKKIAGRTVIKQVFKFVPFAGWAINAGIGFGAMKYVGNSHVDDCYKVCRRVIEGKDQS